MTSFSLSDMRGRAAQVAVADLFFTANLKGAAA